MRMKMTREQKVAHRFLSSFDMVDSRISSSLIALERAESARSSITGSIEGMGLSGSQGDKMCNALVRIEESIDDIRSLSDVYAAQFKEIEDFISDVQRIDQQAGKVLRHIYIDRISVKEVADEDDMQCTKKTVYEHLKRGLEIAFALLAKEVEPCL